MYIIYTIYIYYIYIYIYIYIFIDVEFDITYQGTLHRIISRNVF